MNSGIACMLLTWEVACLLCAAAAPCDHSVKMLVTCIVLLNKVFKSTLAYFYDSSLYITSGMYVSQYMPLK